MQISASLWYIWRIEDGNLEGYTTETYLIYCHSWHSKSFPVWCDERRGQSSKEIFVWLWQLHFFFITARFTNFDS